MALIYRPAAFLKLGQGDPAADVTAFAAAAKEVFVPSPQHIGHIRALVDIGRGHAERNFATDKEYLNRFWEENPWTGLDSAICFSGLGGTGKSHLRRALIDALSGPEVRIDVGQLKNIPVVPCWPLAMFSGSGLKTILAHHLEKGSSLAGEKTGRGYTKVLALEKSRNRTWRDGTTLLLPDELQFFTRGTASTVRVTSALLDLLTIGPVLVYIANFSLVHALAARMDEDTQRLLANHRVLEPDTAGCQYWIKFIAELIKINPEVFDFTAEQIEGKLHRWTFGRRRAAVMLLGYGLKYGRGDTKGKGSAKIRVDERVLERAYHSPDYFIFRESTELLFNQTSEAFRKRTDLWSPFTESSQWSSILEADGSECPKSMQKQSVESAASAAAIMSTATPDERAVLKSIAGKLPDRSKPVRRPRLPRNNLTNDEPLSNIEQFEGKSLDRLR